ncbi:hypothetical protein Smp_136170 [Schistosoma mansoni]|uniref:hypothetical protein n=1 Tax=Schistosoma mansoni TaxID=6183 RepID=UPI0001A63A2B|nr:hypothetical protein Smp_136170 [Schistosoma mansoni]|eukprot:XP_018648399.1 hypothetical protein Smp_136170 [Schistosoma mansoni]
MGGMQWKDFVAIGTSLSARTQQFQALLTETSSSPEYFTKSNLTWNKEFGSNSAEVENHAFNFHKTAIDRFRRNKNVDYFEREYCLQETGNLEYIDAKQASELISTCYPAFLSGHLRRSCWDNYGTDPGLLCPLVYPSQCLYSPLLPIILAALLPNDSNNFNNWGKSLMVLPIHATGSHLFFNEIENEYKSGRLTEGLHIPFHFDGIYIQEYDEIVTQLLYRDTSWLFISLICLLILLTIWTRTIFIPILTVLAIIWSLLTAYTVYTIVLKIPHFPVINLLAIVLVTGLGADDLLVFYQIWKQKRFMLAQTTVIEHVDHDNNLNTTPNFKTQELISTDQNNLLSISSSLNNRTNIISNKCFNTDEIHSISMNHLQNDQLTNEQQLTECLYYTLLHAIPSMTLTTISTICGLLVNLFSSIIAIKRFTIFAILSFISCLNEYISYENQYGYMTGFRFIHKSDINEPVGLIINALTNISLISSSHYDIEKFMNKITIWFNNLLLTAPNLLNHGFLVVNELEKFEITLNITQYIYPSVMIAVIIASLLIFLISKNILLSLLSLICLTCCLLSSITLLTCIDNWKLGIIEGLVISLAAGLAIDPCIHLAYAVSDKCNTGGWRCQQSVCSRNNLLIVLNSLGPAISGSAWTSAITGLPMLFSNLLCFHQIGAFLLTLMFCSWFFCYIVLTGILAFADQVFGYFKSNRVYL